MKEYLIVTDLEGIYGVKNLLDDFNNKIYLLDQIKKTCQYIFDYEKKAKIKICLIHNDGKLLNKSDFNDERIVYYEGFTQLLDQANKADYALLVGFHGKAETGGRFPHSFRNEIKCIKSHSKEIGEVYLYSLFLNNEGIKVIFISGEGNFDDEVISSDIVVHSVDKIDDYERKIKYSLALKRKICKNIKEEDIEVYFKKREIELYLKKKYDFERGALVFKSSKHFFYSLYSLAVNINEYYNYEIKENILFAKKLIGLDLNKKNISELAAYLDRDILSFSCKDRENIRRIIERNYENITFI